jgi:hypothetical protein
MASSVFGKAVVDTTIPNDLEVALFQLAVASWDDVRAQLASKQTDEERAFRANLEQGYGVGSPMHKLRLFHDGNKEEDVRVTFYRDSASWCPYWYVKLDAPWVTIKSRLFYI